MEDSTISWAFTVQQWPCMHAYRNTPLQVAFSWGDDQCAASNLGAENCLQSDPDEQMDGYAICIDRGTDQEIQSVDRKKNQWHSVCWLILPCNCTYIRTKILPTEPLDYMVAYIYIYWLFFYRHILAFTEQISLANEQLPSRDSCNEFFSRKKLNRFHCGLGQFWAFGPHSKESFQTTGWHFLSFLFFFFWWWTCWNSQGKTQLI